LIIPNWTIAVGFADEAQIPEWAKDSVRIINEANIFRGFDDLTFQPLRYATRGEAATVLYRLVAER